LAVLDGAAAQRSAAIIDLGSNTWRLVAYRYSPCGPWRRTAQMQAPVRIAQGLEATGRLAADRCAHGLETIEMFARYASALDIAPADVDVVATSAMRDARDGPELIARAGAQRVGDPDALSTARGALRLSGRNQLDDSARRLGA
jgi:exopolyphosphatase/pppGpp-phosphohydrolase